MAASIETAATARLLGFSAPVAKLCVCLALLLPAFVLLHWPIARPDAVPAVWIGRPVAETVAPAVLVLVLGYSVVPVFPLSGALAAAFRSSGTFVADHCFAATPPRALATRVGITEINRPMLVHGLARDVRFGALARLCAALHRRPGDLFEFVPDGSGA